MEKYRGIYRGVRPVLASASGFGEVEITIDDRLIRLRVATGKGVHSESMFAAAFREMTAEETKEMVETETPDECAVVGYLHSSGAPAFIFVTEHATGHVGLFVPPQGLEGINEPMPHLNEVAVAAGELDKLIAAIERDCGAGTTPRLSNGGYAPASRRPN